MASEIDDEGSDLEPHGQPIVRFVRGPDDAITLRYATFDAILRALHDLRWPGARIGTIGLLRDWVGDRGLFDPSASRTELVDLDETVAALRLARQDRARRGDFGGDIDESLDALIRFLDEAIASGEDVAVELR